MNTSISNCLLKNPLTVEDIAKAKAKAVQLELASALSLHGKKYNSLEEYEHNLLHVLLAMGLIAISDGFIWAKHVKTES